MASVTWRYLAGDTGSFAIEFTLVRDSVDDWMVDTDVRSTWGAVSLWIGGINVCESNVQGEQLHAAHWYLLPIVEWFLNNWDPLLHEERLPRASAAQTAERAAQSSALLAEFDAQGGRGHDAADAHQEWVGRHRLRSSAPGALLPDLYIRRYGDDVEFSVGTDRLPGDDWGVTFTPAPPTRVPVSIVSDALEEAINALIRKLGERHPNLARLLALASMLTGLRGEERYAGRFAWLSGAGIAVGDFLRVWREVVAAVPEDLKDSIRSWQPERIEQPYLSSSPVSLLFGSLSPTVRSDDVQQIFTEVLRAQDNEGTAAHMVELGAGLVVGTDVIGLSPGEAGSLYGDEAWHRVGNGNERPGQADGSVDIADVLTKLGIWVRHVALGDRTLRAVSVLTEGGSAGILVNLSYHQGTHGPVERFTLAHELGHLLLDQGRARQLLVASGPWAPVDIEKRANAFAAAFLMPIPVLNDVLGRVSGDLRTPEPVSTSARLLDVSYTALVSRLQNLGLLSLEEAEILRDRTR